MRRPCSNKTRTARDRAAKLPPLEQAREQVMRLLEVRNRSRRELEQRLRDRGFEAPLIEGLLERLVETGLIDDRRFACERARALGRRKGWGPRKLRADLIRRGIPREDVDLAIDEAYGEETQLEVARRVADKRFGETVFARDTDRKQRARAYRFLLGRGFDPDVVSEVLGED